MCTPRHTNPPTPLHTPSPSKIIQDMLDVTAGVVGGSIGVMGTLTALEVKKRAVIESSKVCSKPSLAQQTPVRSLHLRGKKTEMYLCCDSHIQSCSNLQCPYCFGTGSITCAVCYGGGSMTVTEASTAKSRVCECEKCSGMGMVQCVNCKGDGREVPLMLDTGRARDPESEFEDLGMM